jgi:iron(III) transport system ATP-binding protein
MKSFGGRLVVDGVTFEVPSGQILALLGPSGCGKTTTLRLIAGFESLDEGEIVIDRQMVASGRLHLPPEKRRVGMVFQDYAIFPHLSVGQNVGFGLDKGQATQERVAGLLDFVGLAGQQHKMPHELSGGEQQRVSLARALSLRPAVLLLDEPFSNLDAARRVGVREEVRQLLRKARTTAVFVTHDQEEALFMGDMVAVMCDGRLEQIGTPEEVFHRPRTRFVASFMGQTDFLSGEVTAAGVLTPLGQLPDRPDLAEGTQVVVAVRPDDVVITPDEAGTGRIVSKRFIGIATIYQVALPDGTLLHSWQPHHVQLAEGAAIRVTLSNDHPLPYFQND